MNRKTMFLKSFTAGIQKSQDFILHALYQKYTPMSFNVKTSPPPEKSFHFHAYRNMDYEMLLV